MKVPPSPHFMLVDIADVANADREKLTGGLAPRNEGIRDRSVGLYGLQVFRGIGFDLGQRGRKNVIALTSGEPAVSVRFAPRRASYIVVLHASADVPPELPVDFGVVGPTPASGGNDGNPLGKRVATYRIDFADGTTASFPIEQRFAIQQRHISWSASPFAAVPAAGPDVFATASEDAVRGRAAELPWGRSQARVNSGRSNFGENLWLYAMPNPHRAREVVGVTFEAASLPVAVYGLATTELDDHPLRPHRRRKIRVPLPSGVSFDAVGEIDTDDRNDLIGIDLGSVISARPVQTYDEAAWRAGPPEVQPEKSSREVIIEYAAHPAARLYFANSCIELSTIPDPGADWRPVAPAHKRIRLRIRDKQTGAPTQARLHVHGADGEYLPPLGHHRRVNPHWFEDMAAELRSGEVEYAYVAGECEIDVPVGRIFLEASKGYEYAPLRTSLEILPGTEEVTLDLDRVLDWRSRGWVTSDTHVHFLSPQTALLEGQAEGVNVVNLLAAQWGEMFSNVGDFDGRTTLGARDFGGDGEFVVRVGSEHRMHVLGHISLLGYDGQMIQPLSTAGPQEGALGEVLDVTLAGWAELCRRQDGLVVMPHAPNPQAERAANIVEGAVDAMELMTFNPRDGQLNPFGLADWYRYQNIGHQLPLVGGSDKMAATSVLGGIRTYVHMGAQPFTYSNWKNAVRSGNTFVTVGPLAELLVENKRPGGCIRLPSGGGHVAIEWRVESVAVPVERVEIIVGGRVAEDITVNGKRSASGTSSLKVTDSTWIAMRVRGSWRNRPGDIAAHTSAVQVIVGDAPVFAPQDAVDVLQQIEGAIAFVDTLAPRPEAARLAAMRLALERAHRRLHARLHHAGVDHLHTPIHAHDHPQEH